MANFTLYTKDNCSFCNKAKHLLTTKGHSYLELKVPDQADKEMIQQRVTESGSANLVRTVPQIFTDDKYIGDYTSLVEYLNS
jgi:glutaredoxin